MNETVIWANGYKMPVLKAACEASEMNWNHQCMTHATHLKALGDIIIMNGGVVSFGDFLLGIANNDDFKIACILAWLGVLLVTLIRRRKCTS